MVSKVVSVMCAPSSVIEFASSTWRLDLPTAIAAVSVVISLVAAGVSLVYGRRSAAAAGVQASVAVAALEEAKSANARADRAHAVSAMQFVDTTTPKVIVVTDAEFEGPVLAPGFTVPGADAQLLPEPGDPLSMRDHRYLLIGYRVTGLIYNYGDRPARIQPLNAVEISAAVADHPSAQLMKIGDHPTYLLMPGASAKFVWRPTQPLERWAEEYAAPRTRDDQPEFTIIAWGVDNKISVEHTVQLREAQPVQPADYGVRRSTVKRDGIFAYELWRLDPRADTYTRVAESEPNHPLAWLARQV